MCIIILVQELFHINCNWANHNLFSDTAPEFTFSSAEYEVAEGNRMITVHMDFISGFINENVEIVLSTSDDSAGTGDFYNIVYN